MPVRLHMRVLGSVIMQAWALGCPDNLCVRLLFEACVFASVCIASIRGMSVTAQSPMRVERMPLHPRCL